MFQTTKQIMYCDGENDGVQSWANRLVANFEQTQMYHQEYWGQTDTFFLCGDDWLKLVDRLLKHELTGNLRKTNVFLKCH